MYKDSYNDYIRSVLGYPTTNNMYMNNLTDEYNMPYNSNNNEDLEECYPEIYKIIYPMVCKVCNVNSSRELTKELLEQMTDEDIKVRGKIDNIEFEKITD